MKKTLCFILAIASLILCATGCSQTNPPAPIETGTAVPTVSPTAENAALTEAEQWELLSEAYRYTFPLVIMDWTMKAATNVAEPDLMGHAPINQLIHVQKLADAQTKMVVTPNVDTVYTQAWLDLGTEPQVFVMPETDRFFMTQVLDAWTNTPATLTSGNYLIATTGWDGTVPEGLTLVEVPTDMVWMITRTLINDSDDMENVRAIQSGMQLYPLSAHGVENYVAPKGEHKEENAVVPVEAVLAMSPKDYFDTANALMAKNSPAEEDAEILSRIAALNIGPGMTFDITALQGDVATQWKSMLQSLRTTVAEAGTQFVSMLGGWAYYGTPIGNFGTEYDYRAMIALGGLGANPPEVAIYPKIGKDSEGNELTGENTYIMHFDSFPPILEGGFWSVTAYGSDDFLIDNELDRYCINDRSEFVLNDDGSLDITLSSTAPDSTSNWLPTGTAAFHLFLRIYLPDNAGIASWTAPTITKVQ